MYDIGLWHILRIHYCRVLTSQRFVRCARLGCAQRNNVPYVHLSMFSAHTKAQISSDSHRIFRSGGNEEDFPLFVFGTRTVVLGTRGKGLFT